MGLKYFDFEILGSGVTVYIDKDRRTYNMRYAYDGKQLYRHIQRLMANGYTYVGRDIWKDLGDAILKARLNEKYGVNDVKAIEEVTLKWRHPGQIPEIKKVIFNPPATIVMWEDGTKTIVKCRKGEEYSKEAGLAFCVMKKTYGSKFHRMFKDWCKE